jgi:hypothetical protein
VNWQVETYHFAVASVFQGGRETQALRMQKGQGAQGSLPNGKCDKLSEL